MYKQILVPIDLNEEGFSDKAVELAVWHAQHCNAELHLLNVLPGMHMPLVATYFPKDAAQKMKVEVKQQLQEFAKTHIPDNIAYKTYVTAGVPYEIILKSVDKLRADLIIMPSHKRSIVDKIMLGSVTNKVVQNSPVNVLVVKPHGQR